MRGQVLDDSAELRIMRTDSSWIPTTYSSFVVGAFMVINRRRKWPSRRKAIMSS